MGVPGARRILITGGAGFIGSHLCRRLVAEGDEVVVLDDLSEGTLENLRDLPEVRFVEGDIRDEAVVMDAARGCSGILHHAAKRSVPRSMREPVLTTDVNVRGSLNVLLSAREHGAVLVSASSSSVYGDQDVFPLHEEMDLRPRSPYAASKLATEIYCNAMWIADGMRSVSLRYFNVFGPGQDPASEYAAVIPRFIVACLDGARPVIYGDGDQARDFTYIDDVVDANLLALEAPNAAFGRAFNIGGGARPTSVNRLLQLVAALCDVTPDPVYEHPREGDVLLTEADISSAAEAFGYRPGVPIEDGLRRTVDAFRSSAASDHVAFGSAGPGA
jgi:nucleoside-diphosphate-sugar epimerase